MSSIPSNYYQPVSPVFDSRKTQEEKNSEFFRAIQDKDISKARDLLLQGADVQDRDLLRLSIMQGGLDAVEFLFEMGVDLDKAFDGAGKTPLLFALERNQTKIAKYLIEKGASLSVQDKDGKTPLHYAIEKNNDEIIELLIKKALQANTLSDLYIEDNEKKTALFYAIERGDISTLRSLIEGAEENNTPLDLNASDKNGRSLLFYAVLFNSEEIIRFLMDKGVKVEASSRFLHLAVEKNNTEIVKLLLKNGAASQMTKEKLTNLLFAAAMIHCNKEIQILLIEAGADVNKENRSLLSYLRDEDVTDLGKLLIEKGAHVNVRESPHNRGALHSAIEKGRIEMVRFLIANGADLNIKDRHGKPPLYTAMQEQKYQIAKLLIEKGADINITDDNGRTSLYLAAGTKNIEIARLLIEKGADVNACVGLYGGPLAAAIKKKNIEMIIFLIENGADVNSVDESGHTHLHTTIRNEKIELAKLLIEKGASVNIADHARRTPLYWAFLDSYSPMIELLIENEAPFFIDDSLDLTVTNQLVKKLAYYRNSKMKAEIATEIFKDITNKTGKSALECLEMAIEQSEVRDLKRRLANNDYKDLAPLLKEAQKIEKALKNPKTLEEKKPQLIKDLGEIKENIKALRTIGKKAYQLLKKNKVQKAKQVLGIPLERKFNDSIVCYYLVGLMVPSEGSLEDVKPIIDLFTKINFKGQYESVASMLYNLLEIKKLNNIEKTAILKKIITEIVGKELGKQDFFKALSKVNTLVKLKEAEALKEFINPDNHIEFLKEALDACLRLKFNLNVEDIAAKYESTFWNPKQFRDLDAIFTYLASLSTIYESDKKEEAIKLFSTYIEDVLEGKFIERRYNLESNPHLKKIFQGELGDLLLEKWKENEQLPVGELVKNRGFNESNINYLHTFQQKILIDNHLGRDCREAYPYLVAGLKSDEDLIQKNLEGLNNELSRLKEQAQQVTPDAERDNLEEKIKNLEAQKLLLELCQDKDLHKETQIEMLKKASILFEGSEFQNDLNALLAGLSSVQAKLQNASKYTICATNHPCDILLMGHEIKGSCQRLDGNSCHNIGLLGPLLDGKYSVVAVKNEKGEMVARCLLKVLLDGKTGSPVLFQERLYLYNEPNNATYHSELINAMCRRKAEAMSLPLLRVDGYEDSYPNPVESTGGRSSFEYVDALGGIKGNTYVIPECSIVWAPTKASE